MTALKKALARSFLGSASYYNSEDACSSLSDEELMIRYQAGDETAFEEIHARYNAWMHNASLIPNTK